MLVQTVEADLLNACNTIFGSEVNASIDFLNYLQTSGLKTAYRKRALETHPDRALALGVHAGIMNEKFKEVKAAYEMLRSFIEESNKKIIRNTGYNKQKTRKKRTASQKQQYNHKKSRINHFYTGKIPNRKLLIGQYLYYSGVISWRALIEAIAWQIKHRPRIGQLAVDWGIITHYEIAKILSKKAWNEKFGECALRTGYITAFEHIALLGKQRGIQSPLCHYFIKKKVLSPSKISSYLRKQAVHNLNISRNK
jgi:curved DNA-binding protein CbpA